MIFESLDSSRGKLLTQNFQIAAANTGLPQAMEFETFDSDAIVFGVRFDISYPNLVDGGTEYLIENQPKRDSILVRLDVKGMGTQIQDSGGTSPLSKYLDVFAFMEIFRLQGFQGFKFKKGQKITMDIRHKSSGTPRSGFPIDGQVVIDSYHV